MVDTIKESLEKIYSLIPNFECVHCHKCCGPITWFEPEDISIREYMEKFNIKRILWSAEEFEKSQIKCPYLINDRCAIYPVRPIVCRLQGNISDLKCRSVHDLKMISEKDLENIKKEFFKLVKKTNGMDRFYGTHIVREKINL